MFSSKQKKAVIGVLLKKKINMKYITNTAPMFLVILINEDHKPKFSVTQDNLDHR